MFSLYKKILFITKSAKNIFLALPLLLLLLTLGCSSKDPQSTFDTLGPVSELQLELFYKQCDFFLTSLSNSEVEI